MKTEAEIRDATRILLRGFYHYRATKGECDEFKTTSFAAAFGCWILETPGPFCGAFEAALEQIESEVPKSVIEQDAIRRN